ncbi:hypothetical protein GBA52_010499 [Prunus armeniaca]|nr:hypothetical protein GBA52_010499 [Prunus armeniaca]
MKPFKRHPPLIRLLKILLIAHVAKFKIEPLIPSLARNPPSLLPSLLPKPSNPPSHLHRHPNSATPTTLLHLHHHHLLPFFSSVSVSISLSLSPSPTPNLIKTPKDSMASIVSSKSLVLVELSHEPETQPKNEKENFVVAALAALEDEETFQKTWNLTANL